MNNQIIRQIIFIILIHLWLLAVIITIGPLYIFEKYIWKPHKRFDRKTKEEMK